MHFKEKLGCINLRCRSLNGSSVFYSNRYIQASFDGDSELGAVKNASNVGRTCSLDTEHSVETNFTHRSIDDDVSS